VTVDHAMINPVLKVLVELYGTDCRMVQLEGESSNSLFDILQEWEAVLKTCDSLINTVNQDNDPGCGDEHFGT
jgi:hypothetical protein